MNKRLIATVLAALMAISLIAGCGGSGGGDKAETTTAAATTAATTAAAAETTAAAKEAETTTAAAKAETTTAAKAETTTAAAKAETTTAAAAAETAEDAEAAAIAKAKIFNVFDFGEARLKDHPWTEDPVGRAIIAKTGVHLMHDGPVGDWNEAMTLMIASGDYPDLISHTGNSYQTLVNAGALKPLKVKIMNSPNIVSLMGDEIGKLAFSVEDPEFYAFGNGPRHADVHNPWEYAENGFYVQMDALAHAGYPVLRTWQDFENVIADYKKAYPEINGMPSVGISFAMADGWRYQFSILNTLTNTTGNASDQFWIVNEDTLEVTASMKIPEAREFFRWINHLNDIGLLDPETFTQAHEDLEAKIANGRLIGFFDAWWQFYQGITEATNTWPERNFLGFPILMDPDTMKWRDLQSKGLVFAGGYSVTTAVNDADLDLITNFFDFLASDEGMKLKAWGVEGVHYTYDANDTSKDWQGSDASPRRVDPYVWSMRVNSMDAPTVRWTTGVGKYADTGFYAPGGGYICRDGSVLSDHPRDHMEYYNGQTEYLKGVLDAYGILGLNEMFPKGYPYVLDMPVLLRGPVYNLAIGGTERTAVIFENYKELIQSRSAKAVMAPANKFDAEWDAFMVELDKIGMPELEKEVTDLLRERYNLWYGN